MNLKWRIEGLERKKINIYVYILKKIVFQMTYITILTN